MLKLITLGDKVRKVQTSREYFTILNKYKNLI